MPAAAPAAIAAAACLALGGCAAAAPSITAARAGGSAAAAGPACAQAVDGTLLSVGRRVYAQAAGGRNVVSVERRFARSRALARAVAHGDPAATRAAVAPLLKAQVRRLIVVRGSHVLARVGHTAALAPVTRHDPRRPRAARSAATPSRWPATPASRASCAPSRARACR